MKKLLSILICLLLSVSSMFAAHTITIKAYAVNKDGSTPVGGTVKLKVTKSKSGQNTTKTTNTNGTADDGTPISVTANGSDGWFGGAIGAYEPEVDLSAEATGDGFFVEGIYLEKGNGVLEGAGTTGVHIVANQNETRTYKVVFDKKNSNLPDEITSTNHGSLNFYTGTESDQITSAFYKEKTKINLSNTFAKDGSPLFDYLYLFGVTTGKDGAVINEPKLSAPNVPCNASTPCYVYKKDGIKYIFDSEVDMVQTRFDHGTSMNGKKLYFTGYCPFANIGSQATDEGWMYFTGGRNAKVDIYLENCEILGKYRSGDGSANFSKFATNYVNFDVLTLTQELKGVSSIFVFEGTASTAYVPSIHIKGTNHLKGQFGYITEVLAFGKPLDELMESLERMRNVETYSAPITLKTYEGKVNLIMDDMWPEGSTNRITNGFLKLDAYSINQSGYTAEKCPSIDLGTSNGSLTINGGQYHLRNTATLDGQYTSNLAICYRKFSKADIANLYGFGNDMTEAPVVINSGTFTMYPNMLGMSGAQYYLDDTFMDLRLPNGNGKSQINGGTFNGIANVVFCSTVSSSGASPIDIQGYWLCQQDVKVDAVNSNGTAVFTIPAPFDDAYEASPQVTTDLNAYPISAGNDQYRYGGQSIKPFQKADGEYYVRLLLPNTCEGDCMGCEKIEEAVYQNWAFAIPEVKIQGVDVPTPNLGGKREISTQTAGETSIDVKVNQLMFVDMQGLEDLSVSSQVSGAKLSLAKPSAPQGQITNNGEYTIHKHLNILKTVDADTWYCFTAPFNIDQVSVLEVGENHVSGQPTKQKAIEEQFVKNSEFWIGIHGFLLPNGNRYGTGLTFEQLANSSSLKSQLIPLSHYDGNNMLTANYYLYELENEIFSATAGTGENLKISWKPVKRNAGEPLMYQGKTYAIQFPYCPMCNDLDSRDYYDYWSKKFIRFYGKGAQMIQGSDYQSTILATTPAAGSATLVGNSTLADMTLAAEAGYVHNTTNDFFEKNNSAVTIKPTQGYMLYGGGAKGMPERISRSGQLVYPDNTTTDVEGVPTISDRTSLMLFDAMDGFEVLSLCEQLVMVYNLQGNLIFRQQMAEGEQVHIAAAEGIYVVKGEKEAIKVMVD